MSSTFSDLKEERNALQREVFPKLREMCMEHGFRFQAIDLRWGVSEEAGLDQQTMKICLEEIERSQRVSPKPNFIVLLGYRYGWRPAPYEIPASEFKEIYKLTNEEDKALLDKWFWRDDNAVPPVYDLQPRNGEYEDYDAWMEVENRLNSIFRSAVLQMDLGEKDRLKYFASATEQEIVQGALEVPDAEDHVHCFFRELNNVPCDKSGEDFIDLTADGELDKEASNQIKGLKDKLTSALPGNVHNYNAEWKDDGVSMEHLDGLCDDVYNSLSKVILDEIGQFEETDPLDKEIEDHLDFGRERSRHFQGRMEILEDIESYLKKRQEEPLTIYGVSGSGKTALMAYAADKSKKEHAESEVITRYIGATATSSDIRSLLESLCHQISNIYNADHEGIPTEYQKLVDELPVRLSLATPEKPLIIFLDAMDQLSDFENARSLAWLPIYQPENVHIIVSTILGESLDALKKKFPSENLIELGIMQPGEGEKLLDLWFDDVSRTLKEHQKEEVLGKFSIKGLPLYLKLAFEEARRWKSYTNTKETTLKEDIPQLIQDTFQRLSNESQHGEMMVSKSLCYLTASRYGLSEDEILDVLSLDKTLLSDFKRRSPRSPDVNRLPVVVWSRLYFDLEPYLTERSMNEESLLNFYHRQFTEVITKKYLSTDLKKTYNLHLADYFNSQILNERKVDELPWQLDQAESWGRLVDAVTDMDMFMELSTETKQYELMGYWHHLPDEYNMVAEYQKALQKYEKETTEENPPTTYDRVARFLQINAYYKGAEPLYRRALKIREKVLGPNHPNTATSLNNLASLLQDKGDLDGAEILFSKTLEINERVLGLYNQKTANSLVNLGNLLRYKGDFDRAEPVLRHALEITEKVLGSDHIDTATSLNQLALLLHYKGDLNGAEHLYTQALEINERVLGPEHPNTATSLNNLAGVLQYKGDFNGAEPLYRRALKIREKVLGPKHPITAQSLDNLAMLLKDKGDLDGAELLCRRALKIYENVLGIDHLETATSLDNLANLLKYKGDLDGAEPLYWRAYMISSKVLGPDHPETITSLNNLASLLQNKGDLQGAESLYSQALEINERVLGPEHPNTATSLNNLASLLQNKGDLQGAESLYSQALEINERVLGPEHPNTATSLNNLAGVLQYKGDFNGAEPLYRRALKIREKVLGPQHRNTATSLNQLAALLKYKGDLEGSESLFRRALKISEKVFGPDHPSTITILTNLALLLMDKEDFEGAEPLFRRALKISEKVFGPDHPNTAGSLNVLALLLFYKVDYDGAEPLFRRALKISEKVFGPDHPNTSQIRANLNVLLTKK